MDKSGPAFPMSKGHYHCGEEIISIDGQTGMTLRDWFAGQALTGLCAKETFASELNVYRDVMVKRCYIIADLMLKAREATNG